MTGCATGAEPRINAKHIDLYAQAGEAEHYRLPQTSQSGDSYATGAVRVQFKVGGCGLAQKTNGGFGFAEPCGDQRVDTCAQRTTMRAAWLVVVEIGLRRGARELVRQEGEQRHHIGLFDHLRPLCSLTADHHVD